MRLTVHDFSGHPFQVQLSRHLARRGHQVMHEFSTQYVSGRGRLQVTCDDPDTLRIEGVTARRHMRKYAPVGRARFELSYARAWQARLDERHDDVVVACNVPLFALASMRRYFEQRNQPWVLWHQDIHSAAVAEELDHRFPGRLAATGRGVVGRIERAQVRSAQQVVAIHSDFARHYEGWGLNTDHVEVIPNWAPLDEVVPGERDNAWAREQSVPAEPVRLLYAGTLGRKHNPLLLLELLDAVRAKGVDAMLIVCSEGVGADDLVAAAGPRTDVRVLGYQPAERFSEVLASADAMVVLLEPAAAAFSVPSKVQSYLAAGRPTIGLMPAGNAAALDVRSAGGYVGPPTSAGAQEAAEWLAQRSDPGRVQLTALGSAARELATRRSDVGTITDRFEAILARAAGRASRVAPATPAVARDATHLANEVIA
ncbi:MAG: glycosyltransferase family 4 protein [Jatrophihabitans sp.]